jgi:hypothetical protein
MQKRAALLSKMNISGHTFLECYTASNVLWSVSRLRQLVSLNFESVVYLMFLSIFLGIYIHALWRINVSIKCIGIKRAVALIA